MRHLLLSPINNQPVNKIVEILYYSGTIKYYIMQHCYFIKPDSFIEADISCVNVKSESSVKQTERLGHHAISLTRVKYST